MEAARLFLSSRKNSKAQGSNGQLAFEGGLIYARPLGPHLPSLESKRVGVRHGEIEKMTSRRSEVQERK